MSAPQNKILVVGGGSRIAAALAPLVEASTIFVSRRPSRLLGEILVDDYGAIPAEIFETVDCVVNCVGVNVGESTTMQRVNVDIPIALARAAQSAGVRRLIHISSFSVYGGARVIEARTPVSPASAYGRSKLAADTALLTIADERLAVAILRLPLIYGRDSLGKLGQLLKAWRRMHVLPVPTTDVVRAMIGAELTADVIAHLLGDSRSGILFAADPAPFTYARAAEARPESLSRLAIPGVFTRAAERVAPAVAARLFADSRLADTDNLAVEFGLSSRLYRDIAAADLR